jgi:hypothetical protein
VRKLRRQIAFPNLAPELYRGLTLRFSLVTTTAQTPLPKGETNPEGGPATSGEPGQPIPAEGSAAASGEVPSAAEAAEAAPAPRRWRRTLSPEELEQQRLLNQELLDQQLLAAEDSGLSLAPESSGFLNLEPSTPPTLGRLREWRQKAYRSTSPENWSALQRRLAIPPAQQLIQERRSELLAASRLGGWLARGDSTSALLQQCQWQQKLALWGMTLKRHRSSGILALGTPTGGVLTLGSLLPLLLRLRRRRSSLADGQRRRQRRGRRLRRRSRRLRRIKARRRRFWRLTHRRRWDWWHRRSRRRSWHWNPRLVVR